MVITYFLKVNFMIIEHLFSTPLSDISSDYAALKKNQDALVLELKKRAELWNLIVKQQGYKDMTNLQAQLNNVKDTDIKTDNISIKIQSLFMKLIPERRGLDKSDLEELKLALSEVEKEISNFKDAEDYANNMTLESLKCIQGEKTHPGAFKSLFGVKPKDRDLDNLKEKMNDSKYKPLLVSLKAYWAQNFVVRKLFAEIFKIELSVALKLESLKKK